MHSASRNRVLARILGTDLRRSEVKRLNVWVHREYMRLFERCFAEYWPEWNSRGRRSGSGSASLVTLHERLDRGSRHQPPARTARHRKQIEHLRLHLDLLRQLGCAKRRQQRPQAA